MFHAWLTFILRSIWCFTSGGPLCFLPHASSPVRVFESGSLRLSQADLLPHLFSHFHARYTRSPSSFEQGKLQCLYEVFVQTWCPIVITFCRGKRRTSIMCMKYRCQVRQMFDLNSIVSMTGVVINITMLSVHDVLAYIVILPRWVK